jgi:hypothetical protein
MVVNRNKEIILTIVWSKPLCWGQRRKTVRWWKWLFSRLPPTLAFCSRPLWSVSGQVKALVASGCGDRYYGARPESKDTSRVGGREIFYAFCGNTRRPWSFTCEPCSFDSGRTGFVWVRRVWDGSADPKSRQMRGAFRHTISQRKRRTSSRNSETNYFIHFITFKIYVYFHIYNLIFSPKFCPLYIFYTEEFPAIPPHERDRFMKHSFFIVIVLHADGPVRSETCTI